MSSEWELFLYINNRTSHTLKVDLSKKDWGRWYRNSTDNQKPIEIKPGEYKQAMGIRASHGTATGYECRCRWSYKDNLDKTIYSVDLKIDVPYIADNSSSLTTSGPIMVDGWDDLPKRGHNFTRTIVVSETQ